MGRLKFIFGIFGLLIGLVPLHAEARNSGKNIGIDLVAGFPQLLGLELRYVAVPHFEFGASFGSAPINGLLNSKIKLNERAVSTLSGDPLTLVPSATYSLTGFTLFTRYLPWQEGWFAHLGFTSWAFNGTLTGNLRNETTGGIATGAISGTLELDQKIISLMWGHQWTLQDFFFEFGLGVGYLIPFKYSLTTGGAAATFQNIAPSNSTADLETAESDFRQQADTELTKIKEKLNLIPLLFVSVGWTF